MADISQQITQQRSQVEQARQRLQEERARQQQVSQAKLRGIERGVRQQKSALTMRAERKASADITEKSLGEVSQFETRFEQEVASKVPQYGKQEYIDLEYQKATQKIQNEISLIKSKIEKKQLEKVAALNRNAGERADDLDNDIDLLEARIVGYNKALRGSKEDVIQNVNTGYAEQLAGYEEARKQEKQQLREITYRENPIVLESVSKPSIQPVQDFTYKNILTGEKMSALAPPSKLYVKETPFSPVLEKSELKSVDIPKSSISKPSMSGNIILNNVNLPNMNELDVSTREGGGFLSSTLARVNSFIGGSSDFKKGYQKEYYDSRTNTFVSASPTGLKATPYIRPPTPEEAENLDKLSKTGQFIFRVEKKSQNLFTADIGDLERRYKESEKAREFLESNQKNIDSEGNWIGSEEDLTRYNANIGLAQQTIRVGLFGGTVERNIGEFNFLKGNRPIGTLTGVVGETLSTTSSEGWKSLSELQSVVWGTGGNRIISESDIKITPEKTITITKPLYGTVETDPLTGNIIYSKQETIILPEKKELKKNVGDYISYVSAGAGKASSVGGRIVPYANPIGGYIFAAEQLERVGANVVDKGSIKAGTVSWFKESPIESTVAIALPLLKGIQFGASKFKITKSSKYLNQPSSKIYDVQSQRQIVNTIDDVRLRPSISVSQTDDLLTIQGKLKAKGGTSVTEMYPSNTLVGSVDEFRDVGKIKLSYEKGSSFWNSKIKVEKAIKQFKGDVILGDDFLKETINVGDDLIRVTNIKNKVGTVELIKPSTGEVLSSSKITVADDFFSNLKNVKTKTTTPFEVDTQINNPLTITETKINRQRVGGEVKTAEGDIVKFDKFPNLMAEKTKGLIKSTLTKSDDISTGRFSVSQDVYGFSDIIKSGETKGLVQMKVGGKNIVFTKKQGMIIEYGDDLSKDFSRAVITNEKSVVQKVVRPNVNREIIETSGQRFVFGYTNPKNLPTQDFLKLKQQKVSEAVKTFKTEVVKQKQVLKLNPPKVETAYPSYVGGSGGEGSQSLYIPDSKIFATSSPIVYVEDTSSFLKGSKVSPPSNIPTSYNIANTNTKLFPLVGTSKVSGIKEDILIKEDNVILNDVKSMQIQNSIIKENLIMDNIRVSQLPKQSPSLKTLQKEILKQEQNLKLREEFKLTQESLQKSKQSQRQKQSSTQRQRSVPETKIKMVPPTTDLGTALKQVKKKLKEDEDLFEIFATKEGKDVLVGSAGTQGEAEKLLKGTLTKTLRAGGFIQRKGGQKLRATELKTFGTGEFRLSKASPFKIIEKRSKRLRKSTTGKQIQAFRPRKGKLLSL